MSWLSLLGALAIGSAAALLSILAGRLWVPPGRKDARLLRQIIVMGLVALSVTAWITLINPALVERSDFRRGFERSIGQLPAGQLFVSMRKHDRANYDRLVGELAATTGGNGELDAALVVAASRLGAAYSAKYYQGAENAAVFVYLEKYGAFLAALADREPLTVCRLENPAVHGNPDAEAFRRLEAAGIFEALDGLIQSAMRNPTGFDQDQAAGLYRKFSVDFKAAHPADFAALALRTGLNEPENVRRFARASAAVYRSMMALGPETGALVYKYMRSGL